jgi:transcriptional regulator with XRE-family HTH domain
MRRLMLGISQEKMGAALGLTFQQVQKYEKGTNRISASRLQHIAHILQVPMAFLFEGGPDHSEAKGAPDYLAAFLASPDGLALARAFTRIAGSKTRRCVVRLVEEIAATEQ